MAVLNLELNREADKDSLNAFLRRESLEGPLHSQVDYIDSAEVVSTDFVGSRAAGVIDGLATITNGRQAILYVWYDNEFGYSAQVVRVLEHITSSAPAKYPRPSEPHRRRGRSPGSYGLGWSPWQSSSTPWSKPEKVGDKVILDDVTMSFLPGRRSASSVRTVRASRRF